MLSTKGLGSAVVRSRQPQVELSLVTWLQKLDTFPTFCITLAKLLHIVGLSFLICRKIQWVAVPREFDVVNLPL